MRSVNINWISKCYVSFPHGLKPMIVTSQMLLATNLMPQLHGYFFASWVWFQCLSTLREVIMILDANLDENSWNRRKIVGNSKIYVNLGEICWVHPDHAVRIPLWWMIGKINDQIFVALACLATRTDELDARWNNDLNEIITLWVLTSKHAIN